MGSRDREVGPRWTCDVECDRWHATIGDCLIAVAMGINGAAPLPSIRRHDRPCSPFSLFEGVFPSAVRSNYHNKKVNNKIVLQQYFSFFNNYWDNPIIYHNTRFRDCIASLPLKTSQSLPK